MNDQKVIIYGTFNNGSSLVQKAVTTDNDGNLNSNLYLGSSLIFSLNPFSPEFNIDAGILDMLPVVNFGYLAGPDTGTGASTIFGRQKYASDASVVDPTAAMMVKELAGQMSVDAPAANTAASLTVAADTTNVLVKGFGYTVTGVAAIAAPVTIELREDTGGANTLRYQAKVLVPAGQSKEVWIDCDLEFASDVRITATNPGATNFVSVMLETNTALGNAPS